MLFQTIESWTQSQFSFSPQPFILSCPRFWVASTCPSKQRERGSLPLGNGTTLQNLVRSLVVVDSIYVNRYEEYVAWCFEFHNTIFSFGGFSCVGFKLLFAVVSEDENRGKNNTYSRLCLMPGDAGGSVWVMVNILQESFVVVSLARPHAS